MSVSTAVTRLVLIGVLVLVISLATAQESTDAWPRSLPDPATLTQLALSEVEAEEKSDKEADDTTRSLLCRAWLFLNDEDKALKCAIGGSQFDNETNLALFALAQDQVSILGHPPSLPLAEVKKLTEEAEWLWPLSIVQGYLDAGQPDEALRHLPEVPIDKGTFGPVLPEIVRLAQQLKKNGDNEAIVKLAKEVLSNLEKYRPSPSDNPVLASLAKLCVEIQEPGLANEFRRHAIAMNEEYRRYKPTGYTVFALMQAALANHVTGNLDEAQRQFEQAIQQCDQIMNRDELTDLDLHHRYDTLLKMSVQLNEFGLPRNALPCLLRAAVHASQIENQLSSDAASHKLAETARTLGYPELASQHSDRIQRPGFKLTDLRKQVERLRTGSRIDEARQVLETAERLAMQHIDDEFHIGETAELGLSRALLGDVAQSREHFQRALKLSRDREQDFHQSIARLQVKAGQFEDAYQTLREMTSRRFRVYALAELAQAVTKREYERRRK